MIEQDFFQTIAALKKEGTDFVIVTMVDGRGSIPQKVGAKALFSVEGLLFGTIGGGKLEQKAFEYAKKMIQKSDCENSFSRWNLQQDVGMTCGGEVSLYFENHTNNRKWNIAIFGAGHVSNALCQVLSRLDCSLTVIDTREEWLEKLPESVSKIQVKEYQHGIDFLTPKSFTIVMTQGHGTDLPVLKALRDQNIVLPYLGVIGSKAKSLLLKNEFEDGQEWWDQVYCPIGEKFGNNTPEEIALSISAQLLKIRDSLSQ